MARRKRPARLKERRATDVLTVEEMRRRARRRLPRAVFDGIDGGAGDEVTVRANRSAYDRLWIRPRALADVAKRDLSTSVLGERISLPVMLAPCGFARVCDSEGELAIKRAAAAAQTAYVVSGASAYSLEEIRAAAPGPAWYQIYLPPVRDEAEAHIRRVKAAGYRVLCVTIDTVVAPIRDRDYYNRLTLPIKWSPTLIRHGLSRPLWAKDFLLGRVGQVAPGRPLIQMRDFARTIARVRPVTIEEIAWVKETWDGPLVVKGVLRGDEVPAMIEAGADAIIVSNHGGRNLDGARPTIEALPEVLEAADGRAEIYVDGGVRRGGHVLKALALGAQAVLIGRPYMFGLAAYGQAGVRRTVEILRLELENAMALAGCASVSEIDRSLIVAASG